jgi:hypothetical protein
MPIQYPAMINFYMIRHPDEPKFRYVGSTAHSLEERLKRHKADMLRGKNCRSAVILIRYPDAEIVMVDERMCEDIAQRNKIEGMYIKCFKPVNLIVCGRTPIQYAKYRRAKRDEEGKIIPRVMCECGVEVYEPNLDKHQRTKSHSWRLSNY